MNEKRLTLSTSFQKTDNGMWIVDFYYDIPENEGNEDEELHRFYTPPYAYVALQEMMKARTKIGTIYGYIKKHSDQILPKKTPPEELIQNEFKFESANFKTFCTERSWMELLDTVEPYQTHDAQIHPSFDTKMFDVTDKNSQSHNVIVNAKYGPMDGDNFSRIYFNRLPDSELTDTDVGQNGIIFEFGTDLQQTILNIFDRRTTIKIIATVYQIMYDFAQNYPDAQWVVFGGYSSERSKMKMYASIAAELAQKFNLQRKVIQGNVNNETFYLLYRG